MLTKLLLLFFFYNLLKNDLQSVWTSSLVNIPLRKCLWATCKALASHLQKVFFISKQLAKVFFTTCKVCCFDSKPHAKSLKCNLLMKQLANCYVLSLDKKKNLQMVCIGLLANKPTCKGFIFFTCKQRLPKPLAKTREEWLDPTLCYLSRIQPKL